MMKNILKAVKMGMVVIFTCLLLTACSRVTQDNFAKIETGMSMDQVEAILGKPDSTQSVSVAGLSGTSATWKSRRGEITVQFANDKVAIKNFSKKPD